MSTRQISVIAIAILLTCAALLGFWRHSYLKRLSHGEAVWKQQVTLAARPGATQASVIQSLGQPEQTLDLGESNRYARPTLSVPAGTTRALVYSHTPSWVNLWTAYILIGKDGKVIGCEIRST